MMKFMPLILSLLTQFMPEKNKIYICKKLILNIMGVVFLVTGMIVGFVALYHYLSLHLGETTSLAILCALFILIGFVFFGVGAVIKARKVSSSDPFSTISKALSHPSHTEFMKNLPSTISPKVIVGVFASVLVISYFIHHGSKKD